MTITRQQVEKALTELRVNRPRLAADRMIRGYLQRFGNGATTIGELDPALYEAVFAAVGGSVAAQDFYGVTLDVQPPQVEHVSVEAAPPARTRVLSPLIADLERKLAERAGKPRSRPNYVANVGNPARRGDDDAPRQYPSDGVKVS